MRIPDVLPLLHDFARTPGNEAGGHLDVVFDHGKVADEHVRTCLKRAEAEGDEQAAAVAHALLAMPRTQRAKVAGMFYDLQAVTLSCDGVLHETGPDQTSCSCVVLRPARGEASP